MNAPTRRLHSDGFTLIELLIVVAIIAILAAIAVPNFLEAQMRSKIARVKADMRSMATAIETYMVDANKYPPTAVHSQGGRTVDYPVGFVCGDGGGWMLTTPIAYITTWPKDPFPDLQGWSYTNPKGLPNRPIYYTLINPEDGPVLFFRLFGRGDPERAMGLRWATVSPGPTVRNQTPGSEGDGGGWYNYGAGFARSAFPSVMNHYDATNGTRSTGSIVRYGPGGGNLMSRMDPEPS